MKVRYSELKFQQENKQESAQQNQNCKEPLTTEHESPKMPEPRKTLLSKK